MSVTTESYGFVLPRVLCRGLGSAVTHLTVLGCSVLL